jgi:hypothetical protein
MNLLRPFRYLIGSGESLFVAPPLGLYGHKSFLLDTLFVRPSSVVFAFAQGATFSANTLARLLRVKQAP